MEQPPNDTPGDKIDLRRHCSALREGLTAGEVAAASASLCQLLASWEELTQARTVLAYIAFRNEPNLQCLFEQLPGIQWVVPRIVGQHLILHPFDRARLVRHRYGMLEPAADLPTVDPADLDVVLVPGVAFDRSGGRLGLGGGFYDRFLPTTPALRVGVTYDRCLVASVPCSEHDQRMDWVVTQTQRIHCAPRVESLSGAG